MSGTYSTNKKELRQHAISEIQEGAVTEGYAADRDSVIQALNEALATELVCTLRYRNHYHMTTGPGSAAIAEEFLEHARQEQDHADAIAHRITQLGGVPDFNPEVLASRSHAAYCEGGDLTRMIGENLVAERIAIEAYSGLARWLGDSDPTTRRMIEDILSAEEEHASDLTAFLEGPPPVETVDDRTSPPAT